MNNKDLLLDYLVDLVDFNLSKDEAKLYVALLAGPNTHQKLARQTGINRTKVYRLAEDLIR
jgi:sugar-specific transcriptional regulator TrmB